MRRDPAVGQHDQRLPRPTPSRGHPVAQVGEVALDESPARRRSPPSSRLRSYSRISGFTSPESATRSPGGDLGDRRRGRRARGRSFDVAVQEADRDRLDAGSTSSRASRRTLVLRRAACCDGAVGQHPLGHAEPQPARHQRRGQLAGRGRRARSGARAASRPRRGTPRSSAARCGAPAPLDQRVGDQRGAVHQRPVTSAGSRSVLGERLAQHLLDGARRARRGWSASCRPRRCRRRRGRTGR